MKGTTTMTLRLFVWIGTCLLCVPTANAAGKRGTADRKTEAPLLIEAEQLEKKLNNNNLRILDVRPQAEYDKAHIPGAVRVDVRDWRNLAVKDNGLHDASAWAEKVGALGITRDTVVVVYGRRVSNTARIWWLLEYVGMKNALILNGGWEWWTRNNRVVDTSTPQVEATKFKPEFQADRLAEIDSVKKSLKSQSVTVVDTRSDSEFAAGRIPDAVHLEWKHLLAQDGRFKTPMQLKSLFRTRGIMPSETAVCY